MSSLEILEDQRQTSSSADERTVRRAAGSPRLRAADTAATVLRQVTRDLRTTYPDHPDLWAALVHSGP